MHMVVGFNVVNRVRQTCLLEWYVCEGFNNKGIVRPAST